MPKYVQAHPTAADDDRFLVLTGTFPFRNIQFGSFNSRDPTEETFTKFMTLT